METKCIYFCVRSKNYKKYFYCRCHKKEINNNDCWYCNSKEYKERKTINKVSKKRVCVSKDTYKKVFQRDNGRCRLCGSPEIQLHHIIYRSEDKSLIDEPNNCIMLCGRCHSMVHRDKNKWQPYLKRLIWL